MGRRGETVEKEEGGSGNPVEAVELGGVGTDLHEKLVAMASHDLRTPVSSLRLLHDLLRSKLTENARPHTPREISDLEELLDIMARNLDRMEAFIGDILETWRLYRGGGKAAKEPVNLNAVVEDMVASLFPSAMKKDIALDLVTDASLRPVAAEARRVGQVVANLVGNAIKYTPAGGAVTVYTRPAAGCPGVEGGGRGGAVLEVADTGPGVPEGERGSLFERFSRGSARATGGEPSTGLGLFICREIADLYGGRIWFEPGVAEGDRSDGEAAPRGSRFLVFWPAYG